MSDHEQQLERVRVASAARRAAELEYRAAILDAVDTGAWYSAVAREAGVTRQGLRQLVVRARSRTTSQEA